MRMKDADNGGPGARAAEAGPDATPDGDEGRRRAAAAGEVLPTCAVPALLEREDPSTLERAIALVCPDLRPTGEQFDAIVDAWERHRHVRHAAWD